MEKVKMHELWAGMDPAARAALIERIEHGSEMEAVKHLRAATGLGLADSQAAIDAVLVGPPPQHTLEESVPLSAETLRRLQNVFEPNLHDEARKLLEGLCYARFEESPKGLERLRFAALHLSRGTLPLLRNALELARVDWRDLLMATEYAGEEGSYERWLEETR